MYDHIVSKVSFVLTLVFLILSFFMQTFFNTNFSWKSLLNTDGLTLLGILFTFLSVTAPKIPVYRKFIVWILIKSNIFQLDYRLEVNVRAPREITIEDLFELFEKCVISFAGYQNNDYEEDYRSKVRIKLYHRAIAGHCEIKKLEEDDEEEDITYWKICIDGVTSFTVMERNIKFVINSYLDLLARENIHVSKLSLHLNKRNTEYKISQIGIPLSAKKYKISDSQTKIQTGNSTQIIINSNHGIDMISKTKGDFAESMDAIKTIMIS